MKLLKIDIVAILILFPSFIFATDLQVKNSRFDKETNTVQFEVSRKNSWKNQKNFDAVWVFVKFIDVKGNYIHGKLKNNQQFRSISRGPIYKILLSRIILHMPIGQAVQ